MTYQIVNPATGETEGTFSTATDDQIRAALNIGTTAANWWRTVALADRVTVLHRAAELLAERKDKLAETVTREMGKRLVDAVGEIELASRIVAYYADNAEALLADIPRDTTANGRAFVRKTAIGTILGIMPWNYPYYQVVRFAAPNIAVGNTVLVKHSAQCPQTALDIEELFRDAGAPEGVYVNVFPSHDQIEGIIAHPGVAGVSLTGSEAAGSKIGALSGKHLKKVVLELGGSDPYLILDTGDMDTTVFHATKARLSNGGQSCNAGKRFIVLEDLYDEFVQKLTASFAGMTPGDPRDPGSSYGPMSSMAARDELAEQVRGLIGDGAVATTGGGPKDGQGAYFEPTVLIDVDPASRGFHEELFGPVAVVVKATDIDHAVALANDSPFGLGAAVFHRDTDVAEAVAHRIDAGMVWINEREGGGPELPFGGTKRSGFGRELGPEGIDEFVNRKLIFIPNPA
ncbi:NAD-dependent succinate-semialdehyde dehydrogenase [Mycolicibacterium obuense]|uniref:Succinate-semialdehyde dehydrogenase n=1 Tax=Mycolicibacterium obuense TaxID=1807 RepID=A0A0J6VEM9_9MYCO|nr:NAD-dependent succinate-semialdehyde dehydrogenase [Mycolicibacterium obuense]KKF02588.1 succinate-semialdehyde dehydrogenase [Mycolicibacterium obuense]KMO69465.1 Succinate-semialdehyde dehydrogenase [NADP(+)] 1 [Mycolicibacterium obuense]